MARMLGRASGNDFCPGTERHGPVIVKTYRETHGNGGIPPPSPDRSPMGACVCIAGFRVLISSSPDDSEQSELSGSFLVRHRFTGRLVEARAVDIERVSWSESSEGEGLLLADPVCRLSQAPSFRSSAVWVFLAVRRMRTMLIERENRGGGQPRYHK